MKKKTNPIGVWVRDYDTGKSSSKTSPLIPGIAQREDKGNDSEMKYLDVAGGCRLRRHRFFPMRKAARMATKSVGPPKS
ncbi:uncharacterized protein G2W53_011215 [Senna tora]|uniref:Uncharacterized protein n=1 Tax=Senna tora TaxID=362788 RepID=A0A835CC78_9FABA|nr:uncharacterized protein G2W53_011215 [Senna tora]